MNILSLDLGSTMGWAKYIIDINTNKHFICSGAVKLGTLPYEKKDFKNYRGCALFDFLHNNAFCIDIVAYEEVKGHKGGNDSSLYGQFLGILKLYCIQWMNIQPYGIHTGTIKKHITGKGNASKEMMMESVSLRLGKDITQHDEADALGVLFTYMETSPGYKCHVKV